MTSKTELREIHCKGCKLYEARSELYCNRSPITNDIKCPCIDCLVKMMCAISCDDFKSYKLYYLRNYVDVTKITKEVPSE